MAIDIKVRESVLEAVHNSNQSDKVAQKIVNLLEELSNGTFDLNNREEIQIYLNTILEAININITK
ncbi:CxC ATPase DNA modification system associated small protein [Pleurocapsa sp. FMAR1]|uniref:CxC ATPase DNA modification system associated small protein n=1 Tax=Pleurocapsa sp. FMAR1 TaxID=3040204 RepID=UPI0029C74AF7|nr:CxC ATPase DNA modification system associated small protein [Pleurocapsa sp. FMAR1]